jgi:hypothetical protein
MSVSPGTRLGPYEIIAPLGAGGRGEARQSPVRGHQLPAGLFVRRRQKLDVKS